MDIPCNLPQLDADEYDGRAEEIARLTRATWKMPRGPVRDLTNTIEDNGVIIVPMEFDSDRLDAISRWIPSIPPVIFVNKNAPKDRYRMSLAHELGHLIMHRHPSAEMEDQAWRFAGEFLMPERDVQADLTDVNLAKLAILKAYWRVSMSALLLRAQRLEALTDNQYRYLRAQMAKAGYTKREPVELDAKGEQPHLLQELIDAHWQELGYSEADLISLLALERDELRCLYVERQAPEPKIRLIR